MNFCKGVHDITHTKNKMACCFRFARLFKGILGPIFANYTVFPVLRNPKYSPDLLQRFPGHQGKK